MALPPSLEIHLKEVEKYPTLAAKEEKKLALSIMMGNEDARSKLITANMRYVISRAFEYKDQDVPIEDLIQEGYVGLCKAVDRYDPLKGYKFITFASWWIWQGIIQFLTNHSHTVRIPANKISDIRKVRKTEDKLSRELGRPPTLEELDDELVGINVHKLLPWANLNFNKHIHQSSDSSSMTEQDEIDLMAKNSGIPFPQPDDKLMANSMLAELDMALNKLDNREARIIRLYYGLGDMTSLTLEEIGELFDLTRERIRQIKNIALGKLATQGDLHDLLF
jgi:RNA polymerase primary sigma factor